MGRKMHLKRLFEGCWLRDLVGHLVECWTSSDQRQQMPADRKCWDDVEVRSADDVQCSVDSVVYRVEAGMHQFNSDTGDLTSIHWWISMSMMQFTESGISSKCRPTSRYIPLFYPVKTVILKSAGTTGQSTSQFMPMNQPFASCLVIMFTTWQTCIVIKGWA